MDPAAFDKPPFDPIRHRRGGRPRKAPDERHGRFLGCWATPELAARIEAKAAAAGISLSEYMRLVLDGEGLTIEVVQAAPPAVLRQLRVMRNNVKQTLFEAQRGTFSPEVEAAALQALQVIHSELWTLLHGSEC